MNNESQIYEAAKQFQKAIEKMGMKNVVVIYTFTKDHPHGDQIEMGFEAPGFMQAIAACELMKHKLLNSASNENPFS